VEGILHFVAIKSNGHLAVHGRDEIVSFRAEKLHWVEIVVNQENPWASCFCRSLNLFARISDLLSDVRAHRPGTDSRRGAEGFV
jgi:hypothetical protein